VNLARLVELGEAIHQELGREYYLTGAGLKTEPAFQPIYDRFAVLVSDEALEAARTSGSAPLVEWIVGIRIGRLVASLEEDQLRWEQQAVVRACGREVPYLRVPIELANEPDRATRLENTADGLADALVGMGQGAQPYYGDRLGDLQIPVLVIAGGRDGKYASIATAMTRSLPRGELRIIAEAGHAVIGEQPRVVADLVAGFLTGSG